MARPLDAKPFERAAALAPATPGARAAALEGKEQGDKPDRERQQAQDVVEHSGAATRVVRTIKNPPQGRVGGAALTPSFRCTESSQREYPASFEACCQ
jgi:hypothetical protein